ncbi:MAG: hypothetical protein AB7F65_01805 [Dehalococcoidia bacterium]
MVRQSDAVPSAEQRLRSLLRATAASADVARRIGVEHEYAVLEGDTQLDFRALVHELGFEGRVLHPTSPDTILMPSGLAMMADGWVAETASPPEPLRVGAASTAEAWAQWGRQLLERHLPAGLRLHPGSTHISVEARSRRTDQLCLWFAQTFAPAVMLLLDRADSPGILVRPRPRRFEVGGEYLEGERLRAAVTLVAGAVLALESGHELPPALEVTVEPARRRYGWYIDRTAFGPDLYARGRGARLRLRAGGETTAQAQLEASWRIARAALGARASHEELAATDRIVSGETPLPSEDPDWDRPACVAAAPRNVFGRLAAERPGVALVPVTATWDFVALEVDAGVSRSVLSVPYEQLERFIDLTAAGALDDVLRDVASEGASAPPLATFAQTGEVGVFSSVRRSDALLPRDRVGVGPGTVSTARPGKIEQPPPPPRPEPPPFTDPPPLVDPPPPVEPPSVVPPVGVVGGFPWAWIAIPLVSLLVTLGGGAFFFLGGDDPEPTPTPPPTTALAAPTPTETRVATPSVGDTTSVAAAPPVVGPIVAELVVPVTTYRVEAASPAGLPLTYRWFLEAEPGQECGTRNPATSEPTDSSVATWSHENAPSDDNCNHDAPDHPFTVRVEVSDGVNPPVIRTYEGSESGVGPAD